MSSGSNTVLYLSINTSYMMPLECNDNKDCIILLRSNQVFLFNPSEHACVMFLYLAKVWFALLRSVILQSQRFWINSRKNKIFELQHFRPSFQHMKTVSGEICLFPGQHSHEELKKRISKQCSMLLFHISNGFLLFNLNRRRCTSVMKKAIYICLDKDITTQGLIKIWNKRQ